MKCLIVVTHPQNNSLCKQLAWHVESTLLNMGHEVIIEDLYNDSFNPVLTAHDRGTYYEADYGSSTIAEQAIRLKNADAIVLLFPTWWFGFPAMLKGWFDRVWGPGIAFDHASDFGPIKPRLDNLQKVLVVTTLGSPWWVDRLVMRQPVKRIVKLALLGTCTLKCKLQFISLYDSESLNEAKINAFKTKIGKSLQTWKQ